MTKRRKSILPLNNDMEEIQNRRSSFKNLPSISAAAGVEQAPPENPTSPSASHAINSDSIQKLSFDEISKNYDQWMKIAADNKINSNNSWNVQLIDYFHQLNLMRDGDSINFQKASCTLDGCVKVYSTRVDAVVSETSRLLSGLNTTKSTDDESRGGKGSPANETGGDDYDSDDSQQDSSAKKKTISRRHNKGGESLNRTIEKNPSNLNIKKFDLEFSVDPLFRKTCAEFDESGASGLLMSHLALYGNGRLVLDASDADFNPIGLPTEAKTSDIVGSELDSELKLAMETVDISGILESMGYSDPLDMFRNKTLCPSLSTFSLNDTSSDILKNGYGEVLQAAIADIDSGDGDIQMEGMSTVGGTSDDLVDGGGDLELSGDEDVDVEIMDMNAFASQSANEHLPELQYELPAYTADYDDIGPSQEADFTDPIPSADTNSILVNPNAQLEITDEDPYSYIDASTVKDWAPLHWRVHRPRRAKQQDDPSANGAHSANVRKERQQFLIDFFEEGDRGDEARFVKEFRGNLTLSSTKLAAPNYNLLPVDVHYSMADLNTLFLKPKVRFVDRTRGTTSANNELGPADAQYDNVDGDDQDVSVGDFGTADVDVYESSQAFDLEHSLESAAMNPADLSASQLEIKRTVPEAINYSKKAKRVDIKKLKETIWSTVEEGTVLTQAEEQAKSPIELSDVIGRVQKKYDSESAREISVSYYFISLLHLANEKNLRISAFQKLNNLVITRE